MEDIIFTGGISAITGIISAFLAYAQGAKKGDAEAMRTTFEAYQFALENQRKEFEARLASLIEENARLRERIVRLEDQLHGRVKI